MAERSRPTGPRPPTSWQVQVRVNRESTRELGVDRVLDPTEEYIFSPRLRCPPRH